MRLCVSSHVGYFVDIPKPKAWPPPRDRDADTEERTMELLAYGAKRDPVGDKVHLWFACLFMFCLPVAEYPTTIATWALFVYSVMRLPSTWRSLIPIYSSTPFRLLLAWALWTLLSILWSSNQEAGLDHAGALRMVLLPLALWPVMRHWKCFLAAFLAGVFFQNLVQLSEVLTWFLNGQDWLTGSSLGNLSGFEKHPGKAAMFMGFASLSWLGIMFSGSSYKKIAIGCFLLATTGMFATVSMAVAVGYVVAFASIFFITISKKTISSMHGALIISLILLVASVAWITAGDRVISKCESALQGLQGFVEGDVNMNNSTQLRLHWWSQTLKQTFEDNKSVYGLVGHGFGSVESIDFSLEDLNVSSKTDHVHNTFIQILYENGAIGFGLFVSLLWTTTRAAKWAISGTSTLLYPICFGGIALWSVATFFENSQSSGRTLALLILLVTFIMHVRATKPRILSE